MALLGSTEDVCGEAMNDKEADVFSSIRTSGGGEDPVDASERLQFVATWFRVLGFILVGIWILVGFATAVIERGDRQVGLRALLIGAASAGAGILLTTPLYFWFSAIASGVACLVDDSRHRQP